MNHTNIKVIDPNESRLPKSAFVAKVLSDADKLPDELHDLALKSFLVSDGIASGISRDLAFVDKIPDFIKEIMDDKLWECLYVAKGVVTPYYCRYAKGTDSENFRAFITAKRPNGLETSVETLDRVLHFKPEVQRQFRAIIYESRQGERTDLVDKTSGSHCPKLDDPIGQIQQSRIRAANRAAKAIPVIGKLLDRRLIAIDIVAQLGRDIKDPDNLTAEEREYLEKRDLVGTKINQYTNTNPIPSDAANKPDYRRELNRYVKELLGVKNRYKFIRMDDPKKTAEQLISFYKGDKLKELINYLEQGLEPPVESPEPAEKLPQNSVQPLNSTDNLEQVTSLNNANLSKTVTLGEVLKIIDTVTDTLVKQFKKEITKRDEQISELQISKVQKNREINTLGEMLFLLAKEVIESKTRVEELTAIKKENANLKQERTHLKKELAKLEQMLAVGSHNKLVAKLDEIFPPKANQMTQKVLESEKSHIEELTVIKEELTAIKKENAHFKEEMVSLKSNLARLDQMLTIDSKFVATLKKALADAKSALEKTRSSDRC